MKKKIFLIILLLLFSFAIYWVYGLYKYTNLLNAVLDENKEDISYLINEKGYNPNRIKYSANILFFYIIAKQENIKLNFIQFMIDEGFDVNDCSENTFCPIFAAVLNKNAKLVNLLLDKGADVNAVYKSRSKPLSMALQIKDCDMAKILVEKGANFDGIKDKAVFDNMLKECYK